MGGTRNAYNILIVKFEGKRSLKDSESRRCPICLAANKLCVSVEQSNLVDELRRFCLLRSQLADLPAKNCQSQRAQGATRILQAALLLWARRRWKPGIKIDLNELGCEDVNWLRLAEDRGTAAVSCECDNEHSRS
jgi:hypothetical protein